MSVFNRHLLSRAVEMYGVGPQLNQLQEEACELAVSLSHYRRGRCDESEVLAEIGDVCLMLEQARLIFGDDKVNRACAASEDKLCQRMSKV